MPQVSQRMESLDGEEFRQLIAAATRCLESNAEAINALNVFPVPDGDTGVNMLLTMRSLVEQAEALPSGTSLPEVAQSMARGALLGARGNSGVILSQFFNGLAKEFELCLECSGADLIRALQQAADSAYKAVGKPVEGTMLTVMRAAADGAAKVGGDDSNIQDLWAAACEAAVEALARTPDELPVLREAGVVDAGGQGVVALLEGGLGYLLGEEVRQLTITPPTGGLQAGANLVNAQFLTATEGERYGYCTSFMMGGQKLKVDTIRDSMASMADSAVVVGDDTLVKVHVHTFDPGPLISYAVSLGALSQVKIENIDEQHQEFMASHRRSQNVSVAVVAVALGSGLEKVCRNLGAAVVVSGGQTMNPSVQDLLEAVEQAGAQEVLILPNNPNIILTATQSAQLSQRSVHVVPTRNIPNGIAALLAFNPEHDAQANVTSMSRALALVCSGEVTTAMRTTVVNGREVRYGQAMGFLEGELVSVADTPEEGLQRLLRHADPQAGALVTLYWGGDLDESQVDGVAQLVRHQLPGVDLELVHGGQPHSQFILSIE